MSLGFRAGASNDGYAQINGFDQLKIDSAGILYVDNIRAFSGSTVFITAPSGLSLNSATGYLSVNTTGGGASVVVNKPTGAYSAAYYGNTNNGSRWGLELGNATAETGSNAGSDFSLNRYSDAGAFISSAIFISRASGSVQLFGHTYPGATNTYDLGSTTLRWRNVYVNDLQLSNGIGDYTIVEGEDDLFLYNNKRDKVYKFSLIEVDPSEAPPKAKTE